MRWSCPGIDFIRLRGATGPDQFRTSISGGRGRRYEGIATVLMTNCGSRSRPGYFSRRNIGSPEMIRSGSRESGPGIPNPVVRIGTNGKFVHHRRPEFSAIRFVTVSGKARRGAAVHDVHPVPDPLRNLRQILDLTRTPGRYGLAGRQPGGECRLSGVSHRCGFGGFEFP